MPFTVVEVDVEMEKEKDPLDTKEYIVLEEDPEMYTMAGIELVPVPAPVQERIESTIRQAMSSVPISEWGQCECKNCSSQ